MPETDVALRELVRIGCGRALQTLSKDNPFVGFALLTDDDVCTLHWAGLRASALQALGTETDVRFRPTEWTETDDAFPPEFGLAVVRLRNRPESLDDVAWASARDADFGELVAGLATARTAGTPREDLFCTVASTDPSRHMSELAERSLPSLNPPHIVNAWRGYRLEAARRHLAQLERQPEPRSYADQNSVLSLHAEISRILNLLSTR